MAVGKLHSTPLNSCEISPSLHEPTLLRFIYSGEGISMQDMFALSPIRYIWLDLQAMLIAMIARPCYVYQAFVQ